MIIDSVLLCRADETLNEDSKLDDDELALEICGRLIKINPRFALSSLDML
jgi:hypothetical protein